MGTRAPIHRKLLNCSIYFQGVYPNNGVQARLVKIVAKKKLDIPLDELQKRLDTILLLLPDLGALALSAL